MSSGELHLGAGRTRLTARAALLEIRGDWTASYIAMRALGDPDVFLPGDGHRAPALERLGVDAEPERWRPWRSYAVMQLWRSISD